MIGGPGGWVVGRRATRRSFERGSVERGGSFFVPLLLSIKCVIDRFRQMSPRREERSATLSEVTSRARGDDGSMRGIEKLKRGIYDHAEERNPTRRGSRVSIHLSTNDLATLEGRLDPSYLRHG